MTFFVLMRKQLSDMRWSLGIPALAFLALSFLTGYMATFFEKMLDERAADPERAGRRIGILRGLGGPEQDYSTIGIEVCWWNHPFIILPIVGWAIARGSSAIAGEIDRGTMDLTLSRPISRSTYLAAQVAVSIVGFFILAFALAAGAYIAGKVFTLKSPPSLFALMRPASIVFMLGLSIFGYTLPFSAIDSVRWRPGLIALGITLLGVIGMTVGPLFEGFDWLAKLSVFRAYAPVTIALKGAPLAYNSAVLACVFGAGVLLAYLAFLRRDLPATGG